MHASLLYTCTVHTRRALCCSTKPLYIVPQTTNPTGGHSTFTGGGGNAPFAPPPPLVTALAQWLSADATPLPTNSNLCVAGSNTSDSCLGDSGGPLVCGGIICSNAQFPQLTPVFFCIRYGCFLSSHLSSFALDMDLCCSVFFLSGVQLLRELWAGDRGNNRLRRGLRERCSWSVRPGGCIRRLDTQQLEHFIWCNASLFWPIDDSLHDCLGSDRK